MPKPKLAGKNAYKLLGVSETSSLAEIKATFRKLAKETHPDLAQSHHHSSASYQFFRILDAYEVLLIVLWKVIFRSVFWCFEVVAVCCLQKMFPIF